ncbi:hypothetical protein D3C81_2009900 [compost metagenome]
MNGDWPFVSGYDMFATLQCPATEGGRRLTIDRVGKSRFRNDVCTRIFDDRFVKRFDGTTWDLR